MIVKRKVGADIFTGPEKHVAFGINIEGVNDEGFANFVARTFWQGLAKVEPLQLGESLTHEVPGGKTFHAFAIRSDDDPEIGWRHAAPNLQICLNKMSIPSHEHVATVAMGASEVALQQGADPDAILGAMELAGRPVVLYLPPAA